MASKKSNYTPLKLAATIKALARAAWKKQDPSYLLSNNQAELCQGIDQAIANQQRHVVFRCSRRWGKSFTMVVYALQKCLQNPDYKVKIVAGTIKQVRHIVQPCFKDVFNQCPLDLRHTLPRWNNQMGQYEFSNGSVIVVGGADNNHIDDLLGQAANLIIIDEAGYIKVLQDAVNRVLGPMLATTKGTMIIASTPPADPTHYFHELCAKADAEKYLFHRDVYSCDTGLVDPELEKKACGGDMSQTWRREWLALPTLDQDKTVFYNFMDLKSEIVKPIQRPGYFELYTRYTVMDYGFSPDATGILFAWYDYKSATVYIEDEILINRMSTDTLAKTYMQKRDQLWPNLPIYKQAADCQQNILSDLWDRHQVRFDQFTDKGAGSVLQNANNVDVLIRERRLVIDPRCVNLIAQMEYAQWDAKNLKKNSQKRELARSELFQHFDLVSALLYLSKIVDYNYDSVPRYPGFNPITHVVRGGVDRVHTVPEADSDTTAALQDIFGGMVKLGKS